MAFMWSSVIIAAFVLPAVARHDVEPRGSFLVRDYDAPQQDRLVTRVEPAGAGASSANTLLKQVFSWVWSVNVNQWTWTLGVEQIASAEPAAPTDNTLLRAAKAAADQARGRDRHELEHPWALNAASARLTDEPRKEGEREASRGDESTMGSLESTVENSVDSTGNAVRDGVEGIRNPGKHAASVGYTTTLVNIFCALYVLALISLVLFLYWTYRRFETKLKGLRSSNGEHALAVVKEKDAGFSNYLLYRFTHWFVWNDSSKGVLLLTIVFFFLMFGSFLYWFASGTTLGMAIFVVFTQLIEPDGGKGDTTFGGKTVSGIVSVGGLIIFAVLMAFTQDRFNIFLEQLRDGGEPVIEAGHIVLIGWTNQSRALICDICEAFSGDGGCTIAVLSEVDKPDVEAEVREFRHKLGKSSVVVRSGKVHSAANLKLVGAHMCKQIVIMSNNSVPLEARDSMALRVLLTLRSNEWPTNGRILIHCARMKNIALFKKLGGPSTEVVTVEDFVGRIIVQCSRHVGISTVIKHTLGFGGAEFYITPAPNCILGEHFSSALGYFKQAVLAGFYVLNESTGKSEFMWYKDCMDSDRILVKGDEVVLFANDALGLEPSQPHGEEDASEVDIEEVMQEGVLTPRSEVSVSSDGQKRMTKGMGKEYTTSAGRPIVSRVRSIEPREQSLAASVLSKFSTTPGSRQRRGSLASNRFSARSAVLSMNMQQGPETIVLIGWNDAIWHMIYELDASVGYGSKVISFSQVPSKDRSLYLEQQQRYFDYKLTNFVDAKDGRRDFGDQSKGGVFFEEGLLGSRFQLEGFMEKHAMPLDRVSRIFVLSDDPSHPIKGDDPDGGVVSTILHIRQILQTLNDKEEMLPVREPTGSSSDPQSDAAIRSFKGAVKSKKGLRPSVLRTMRRRHIREIPIVVEVRERETEEQCKKLEVMDLVDSVTISAQVLSMLAYEPRLSGMLLGLISEKGNMTFAIRDLSDYLDAGEEPPDTVSFLDVTRLGLAQDELVLGWSRPRMDPKVCRAESRSAETHPSFHLTVDELAGGPSHRSLDVPGSGDLSPHAVVHGAAQLDWDMNPLDKTTPRFWRTGAAGDRLAVLCERCVG